MPFCSSLSLSPTFTLSSLIPNRSFFLSKQLMDWCVTCALAYMRKFANRSFLICVAVPPAFCLFTSIPLICIKGRICFRIMFSFFLPSFLPSFLSFFLSSIHSFLFLLIRYTSCSLLPSSHLFPQYFPVPPPLPVRAVMSSSGYPCPKHFKSQGRIFYMFANFLLK